MSEATLVSQRAVSPFGAVTGRGAVKSAWTDSRHRPALANNETLPDYVAAAAAGLPVVGQQRRPITAGQCARVDHVMQEPVRRQCFTPSFAARQQQQRQQQLKSEENKPKTAPAAARTFHLGPGLKLTRTRDQVLVSLDSDKLFAERAKKEEQVLKQTRVVEDSQRDVLVSQMQRHLDSLVVMLEEERMKRKEEIESLTEEMQSQLQKQEESYEGKIVDLLAQQSRDISQLELQKAEMAANADRQYKLMHTEMQSQISSLKSSFDTFKESYSRELEQKWAVKEAELLQQGEQLAQRLVEDTTNHLLRERQAEVQALQQQQEKEIEAMRKQHDKETQELLAKYSDAEATVQRLHAATHDLLAKEEQLQSLTEQLQSKEREISSLEKSLSSVQLELSVFQQKYQQQVQLVEDRFKSQIETLRLEAVDLRKAYITKCQQLVDQRKNEDNELGDRLSNSKSVMRDIILARQRVKVSLAALDPAESELPMLNMQRRHSQPATAAERIVAARSAGNC